MLRQTSFRTGRVFREVAGMSRLSFTLPVSTGIAAAAAGSVAGGAGERAGKLDAANHSLAAGQKALSSHPLDRDPNTAADRDADGWTGGGSNEDGEPAPQHALHDKSDTPSPTHVRPRLPDDPCGGSLDVVV
jgi:hypothetical protein